MCINIDKPYSEFMCLKFVIGTRQMITIEISPKEIMTTDDEDTANCFLPQDEIDTGGITIPAEPEQTIVSFD